MKVQRVLIWLLLGAVVLPMVVACSAPNAGATDVMTPAQVKAHKIAKDKHEGGG